MKFFGLESLKGTEIKVVENQAIIRIKLIEVSN